MTFSLAVLLVAVPPPVNTPSNCPCPTLGGYYVVAPAPAVRVNSSWYTDPGADTVRALRPIPVTPETQVPAVPAAPPAVDPNAVADSADAAKSDVPADGEMAANPNNPDDPVSLYHNTGKIGNGAAGVGGISVADDPTLALAWGVADIGPGVLYPQMYATNRGQGGFPFMGGRGGNASRQPFLIPGGDGGPSTPGQVPEPASMLMLGAGAVALGMMRRRLTRAA